MPRVLSLGYDLGDGETIIDAATFFYDPKTQNFSPKDNLLALRMPETNDTGQAIPTGYGYTQNNRVVFGISIADQQGITNIHSYFKRKPMDLLRGINAKRYSELIKLFEGGKWPNQSECPEVYSQDFINFKNAVQEFTNAIFTNQQFVESVKLNLVNRDEIIICVGHPTKWDPLDRAIYSAILKGSILGQETYLNKPCSFILAAESRAAYLYLKHNGVVQNTPAGSCSLLIDVGSSTIDVTAVTQDSRNYSYNNGNNYLGVRSIDFMIRDWYFEQLKADGCYQRIENLLKNNPSQQDAVVFKCRQAKEKACSAGQGDIICARIAEPLKKEVVEELASTVSVNSILSKITNIAAEDAEKFGNKSWKTCFKEFLEEQVAGLKAKDLPIGRIIMTGGASKMPFVPSIVTEVFSEVPIDSQHVDTDASRTISRGLALVGPSDIKSRQFQETIHKLNETEIPQIIENDLADLADDIAPVLEEIITAVILERVSQWRNGYITTINNMKDRIAEDLSADNLKRKLAESTEYETAVQNWTENKLGKDIALRLQEICRQYKVTDFTIDDLNIMKTVEIDPTTGKIAINPFGGVVDVAASIAGIIGGMLAIAFLPTIIVVILNIVAAISTTLAGLLFTFLGSIGPIGWTIIAGVVAVAVAEIIEHGVKYFKNSFNERVANYDIPVEIDAIIHTFKPRGVLTDDKVREEIKKKDIRGEVKKAVEDNKQKISDDIFQAIREQVQQKTDDIKYSIESR